MISYIIYSNGNVDIPEEIVKRNMITRTVKRMFKEYIDVNEIAVVGWSNECQEVIDGIEMYITREFNEQHPKWFLRRKV